MRVRENGMIKSMTGYGRVQMLVGGRDILVEIKSVNHRYFDFSARVPRMYGYLEEKLKAYLQGFISRGKLDVYVYITTIEGTDTQVQLNRPLLRSYLDALHQIVSEYGVKDDISVSTLARNSEIFTVIKQDEDAEEVWEAVRKVTDRAIESFMQMRIAEGQRLCEDLNARADAILSAVEVVEAQSEKNTVEYRQKLEARIRELLGDTQIEESRLLTEVAIFADKIAVAEETVRLRSHISQFKQMLMDTGPVGRKMDFLVQEMNREINTIGSKSCDILIARTVVDMKAELEKIREQIQNIE